MQSIDTDNTNSNEAAKLTRTVVAGRLEDLSVGSRKTVELPNRHEIALYNINGEFYASENWCSHKGAPLSEGILCGPVIECDWHGWRFDLRTGECLTVREKIEVYKVIVEDELLKILHLTPEVDLPFAIYHFSFSILSAGWIVVAASICVRGIALSSMAN
jgi:nitrite reductase/ring-hydroxylating ferredoxin subunit